MTAREKKHLTKYAEKIIKMLEEEFCIPLTDTDTERFYNMTSETDIDKFKTQIIIDRL